MKEFLYYGLFRTYFRLHDAAERRFFYWVCRVLRMPHPKNGYPYRVRNFEARVTGNDRLADLGCGSGQLVKALAKRAKFCLGVDLKVPLLLPGGGASANIEFVRKDILDPDLETLLSERQVNLICLSHVLEHLESPVSYLRRLLPFGKILVCVPCQESWRYQFKVKLGLDARTDPSHFREYTGTMLREELSQAGWRPEEVFYTSEGELFASAVAPR